MPHLDWDLVFAVHQDWNTNAAQSPWPHESPCRQMQGIQRTIDDGTSSTRVCELLRTPVFRSLRIEVRVNEYAGGRVGSLVEDALASLRHLFCYHAAGRPAPRTATAWTGELVVHMY
jgi:hypothetical protein